jgi:hypothetical protein
MQVYRVIRQNLRPGRRLFSKSKRLTTDWVDYGRHIGEIQEGGSEEVQWPWFQVEYDKEKVTNLD